MNPYVEQFKQFLKEDPPDYGYEEIHSLLELFGTYYLRCNPIEEENIRAQFCSLEPIVKSLSEKRKRRLFHIISDICTEYERLAFQEGVRAGAQLILELSEAAL